MSPLRPTGPLGRSPVYATGGMAATSHPLASAAALRVLQEGGNAMDAALTAAAVTWVTLPAACGPGGDVFLIYCEAATGKLTAIGSSGVVGERGTPDYIRSLGHAAVPPRGLLSASVPGAVEAFCQAQQLFATRSRADLLAPAIAYAAQGHPWCPRMAGWTEQFRELLLKNRGIARTYLPGGRPYAAGEMIVQADLANSLRQIAAGGAEVFYRGEIAAAIARATAEGGLFGAAELAGHTADVYTPLTAEYRGYAIHQTAPPSQGIIALETMGILRGFDLPGLGFSAAAHHLIIEAKKLAVADRLRHVGDPRFVPDATARLLSEDHLAGQRARIDPRRAAAVRGGHLDGDTVYLCTADRDGNCVSFIHSNSNLWGAGHMVEGTGILLNNRAGRGFVLDPGHPNCIAPGKRTISTLNCYLVTRDGRPSLVGGTPGGDGQPQWNAQILAMMLDWGMDPQRAVEAPRWLHNPSTDPELAGQPETLTMEGHFHPDLVRGLARLGHPVRPIAPYGTDGGVQLIQFLPGGVLAGGSDPRWDGHAAGC